ncbi:hypothetical protein [Sphaerimonospora mesophila]
MLRSDDQMTRAFHRRVRDRCPYAGRTGPSEPTEREGVEEYW